MSENMLFEDLQAEWNLLISRVEYLERQVQQLSAQPAPQAPTPGPYSPPPGASVAAPPAPQAPAPGPYAPQAPTPASQAPTPASQAPQISAAPSQTTPGPQSVPTFEQLLERGMQVSEAKGDKTCIDLIAKYGGKDEQGTIKISLVPQDKYAALFADFGAQLGLH